MFNLIQFILLLIFLIDIVLFSQRQVDFQIFQILVSK